MESTYEKVSSLLKPGYTLQVHSKLNQTLTNRDDIILWNEKPLEIDDATYTELKSVLRTRGNRYYDKDHTLSYTDFCIALLCSSGYSLNHISTSYIPERSFSAAWRTLVVVSNISTNEVKNWINKFISGRSSEGYDSTVKELHSDVKSQVSIVNTKPSELSNASDREIILNLSINDTVTSIAYEDEYDNNNGRTARIARTTLTPEGHLYYLQSVFNADIIFKV